MGVGDDVVPRPRDPRRNQAFEIWEKSNGKKKLKDIASELDVSDSQIRKWKNQDQWAQKLKGNVTHPSKSNVTKQGAPMGNQNAKGHGAPLGNKNAKGNAGGRAPLRNTNAVATGEYQTLWHDALSADELDMLNRIDLDPIKQLDADIELYTWRERAMMLRVRDLNNGLSESQRRVLKERRKVKDTVKVHNDKQDESKTIAVPRYELVVTEDEETSYRIIDDILKIEDALTRVQDKKIKALELKYKITSTHGNDETEKDVAAALRGLVDGINSKTD